ncbi:MAG: hypothetical protein WCA61_10525, partial [Nitrososphaeraceae archaeon]
LVLLYGRLIGLLPGSSSFCVGPSEIVADYKKRSQLRYGNQEPYKDYNNHRLSCQSHLVSVHAVALDILAFIRKSISQLDYCVNLFYQYFIFIGF